jgi:hypothetical protein
MEQRMVALVVGRAAVAAAAAAAGGGVLSGREGAVLEMLVALSIRDQRIDPPLFRPSSPKLQSKKGKPFTSPILCELQQPSRFLQTLCTTKPLKIHAAVQRGAGRARMLAGALVAHIQQQTVPPLLASVTTIQHHVHLLHVAATTRTHNAAFLASEPIANL